MLMDVVIIEPVLQLSVFNVSILQEGDEVMQTKMVKCVTLRDQSFLKPKLVIPFLILQ